MLSSFDKVDKLHSPLAAGNEGQISADRHSALIIFSPRGTYDEATLYIDTIVAATAGVQKAHPDFYVAEAGVSTGKALDKVIDGGVAKVGLIALVLTFVILLLVLGSAVSSLVPVLRRADGRVRHVRAHLAAEQARPDGRVGPGGDPPDRPRGRCRLLALLPPSRA